MVAPRCIGIAEEVAYAALPADYGQVSYGGHCGVLAVAMLAEVPFWKAWEFLEPLSPKPRGKPWQGGTRHITRIDALEAFGVDYRERIAVPKADLEWMRRTGVEADEYLPRMQLRSFVNGYAKSGITYMVTTNRHVVTVRDGFIYDQSQVSCSWDHWAARQMVRCVVERLP